MWRAGFDEVFARISGRFAQVHTRRRARAYLLGLLSRAERKNGWTLAKQAGEVTPDGMQRLLNHAVWDADLVRDDLRAYVVDQLGHEQAVLVADETGFPKKGTKSAGVQRQYSGTAGRIENCQLGVFLAYVSPHGRALIDRELYLPEDSWCADRQRCREAGIDDEVTFATKPERARGMLERAVAAGVPFSWVTADAVYGQNPGLRAWLEEHGIAYVMAIPSKQELPMATGKQRADVLGQLVSATVWQRRSCGEGSQGARLYDWALVGAGEQHRLLIRRSLTRNAKGMREVAYFLCHTPDPAPLDVLVRVAGTRGAIEECFRAAKNEVGLDHYQVRKYSAWYRHITLAMLAHAFLTATATADERGSPDHDDGLTPLSVDEIRRLHMVLTRTQHPRAHTEVWSRRQYRAR
ncbi:IS701 family transposase [Allokutzneria sp. A3M-2-11 16]|uniref:IS701 family transposase n=1 Tax=Allokutzneria sp. A3M-2-11 16 TaxID=2962043 RepID=UPI003F8D017A